MKIPEKDPIKLLEVKTTMSEVKNILNGIKGRLDIALKGLTDLKTVIETLKNNQFQNVLHSCQKSILLPCKHLKSQTLGRAKGGLNGQK